MIMKMVIVVLVYSLDQVDARMTIDLIKTG